MKITLVHSDTFSEVITLSELFQKSAYTVLYFYPKDNTPGCSVEAQDFIQYKKDFEKKGAQIVGVSKDSEKSHCSFIKKLGIDFGLISDTNTELHQKFDAWGEKSMYGKKYMGAIRSTFLIDSEGKVIKERRDIKIPGHVKEVLEAIS